MLRKQYEMVIRAYGRWIGGHFKSVVVQDTEKKEDLSVTSLVIPLLSRTAER